MATKTWILILVFVLILFLGIAVTTKRSYELFSSFDESIEMRLPLSEFQTRISVIEEFIGSTTPPGTLEQTIVVSMWVEDELCTFMRQYEFNIEKHFQSQAEQLTPDTSLQAAYRDRKKWDFWGSQKPDMECFEGGQMVRRVPLEQQNVTTRLERAVTLLEEYMKSPEVLRAQLRIVESMNVLTFIERTQYPSPDKPAALNTLYTIGECPQRMFEYGSLKSKSGIRCCPVEPIEYDSRTRTFTKCPLQKVGTKIECSLKETPELPTCRPDPVQGPCLPDYFFYSASKGGRCCPVPPTQYDSRRGEYTECPNVAAFGRTVCRLSTADADDFPMCPTTTEGFQSRGRALLQRADAIIYKVVEFTRSVITAYHATKEYTSKYASLPPTSSLKISHSSPSP